MIRKFDLGWPETSGSEHLGAATPRARKMRARAWCAQTSPPPHTPRASLVSISRSSFPRSSRSPPPPQPRPAPALSLAELTGWASPGFKGPARRAVLGAAAGPGLAACGGGCPEEAAAVAAAVRPRPPGPRLPSCQVGRRSAHAAPPLPS